MSAQVQPESEFEIAHVLCTDIVGYSKLTIDQQSEYLRTLNDVVRRTEQVQRIDASGKLIRIPTGDGMVLVFFTHPQDPAECAVQIAQALKSHPEIQLRMGVHSGPVNRVSDVNERSNVAGAGINFGQRVMDCGDAGHILLSKRVAEDLAHYSKWRPHLHDLGECEVKHGVKVGIVNLCTGEVGNPAMPAKLKESKQIKSATSLAGKKQLVVAALLGLLAVGSWFFSHRAPNLPLATVSSGKSIAVLPFKPLVASNRDEVLEVGMADTLITKLGNSREIIVPSLTSVRKYDDQKQDPVTIGRALRVNLVLEGSVQKSADRIRVTVRLIKVADGSSLWASTFDEKFTDVFTLQDTISRKVAEALVIRLSREEEKLLTKHYTENVAAYQLYLTGRYHWNKLIPPEIAKSIGFFQQAIDADPHYALAYFGLAEAYRALAITSDARPKDSFPQAAAAAKKALEIDESLAEPHATLSLVRMWFDWDWIGAERLAKQAIALNRNSGLAHMAYAHLLSNLGRHEEAIVESARDRELDPVSLIANAREGAVLYYAMRYDEARERLLKTVELDPNFWVAHLFLGHVYLEKGNYPGSIEEFTEARDLSRGNSMTISMIGYVSALAGDATRARAMLDELKTRSAHQYTPPYNIAVVYLGLGERDEALAWLEKAYQEHDTLVSFLKIDPKWNSCRSDPRFAAIFKRIGL